MKRGRGAISVLLILSLLATGGMRVLVQSEHDRILPRPRAASRLSGMDSFALGLLLGGLRGPLVMVLWSTSENQKIAKDLEDIDTKIEWIRLLQPNFDSVHIFQMWNLAYNLSVMMANIQNKYAMILSGVDYGRSVLEDRPDNLNVLYQVGDIYFNKLGNPVGPPSERRYYNNRLAAETMAGHGKTSAQMAQSGGVRRTRHDVLLDANGLILPALLAPRPQSPALAAAGYSGADLQYLAPLNTPEAGGFPYGIHPLALAYNYYERAAVLQAATGQRHLYIGDSVIDSRPAVALKFWSENMWEHALRLESRVLGKALPDDLLALEPVTASLPLNSPFIDASEATRKQLQEAVFTYHRAADVCKLAVAKYQDHITNAKYADSSDSYFSHRDTALALAELLEADGDYLSVMAASAPFSPPVVDKTRVDALRRSAGQHYRRSIELYYAMILKYYTDTAVAAVVYPQVLGIRPDPSKPFDKAQMIQNADPKRYAEINKAVDSYMSAKKLPRDLGEDVQEYLTYIHRAEARLKNLE